MALPRLIEIVPPAAPPAAEITIPGSKSITNRALVLAALSAGETELRGALWSEDTQVMVECLRALGYPVQVRTDPQEPGNRRITLQGRGHKVPRGGTPEEPMELCVGNAGTAARFLAALLCLGRGVYRLHGVPRMHERPQAELFAALRQLGYRIETPNERLPVLIHGGGARPGTCTVSVQESSQFASALLLAGKAGGWQAAISGGNEEELPYVTMTARLLEQFPETGGIFQVEPDASSGSYFWGAKWVLARRFGMAAADGIAIRDWPESGWQIDANIPRFLFPFLAGEISRARDLGDAIMTAIALAPLAEQASRFTDLGRLRVQECERVAALRDGLTRCGATVTETGDTLAIQPGIPHGAEIETHDDHRLAMCFAILGLHVPGIKIKNPACVKKTFPNFFQKLAAPAPDGLGIEIRDAASGQALAWQTLGAG